MTFTNSKEIMTEMDYITDAATDIPDERDIPYELVFSNESHDRVTFPYDKLTIQNQRAQEITRNACSRYGMAHIVNGQTLLLDGVQKVNGIDLWRTYIAKNPNAQFHGATLQSMLKQAKEE